MRETARRSRAAALSPAALDLAPTLSGRAQGDTTAPSTARAGAAHGAPARIGTVGCRETECIALTFDPGPGENSARPPGILKEKKVPATFFLLARNHIETYPRLVERMAAEGHEVASHTWDHKILTRIPDAEIREELKRPDDAIERLTGHKPTMTRPPQGRTDSNVHKTAMEMGLAEVLWSVAAKDCTTNGSELITKRVLDQASRDGIIPLHDSCPGTVPAVPGIIGALKARGHVFVTVPHLPAPGKGTGRGVPARTAPPSG